MAPRLEHQSAYPHHQLAAAARLCAERIAEQPPEPDHCEPAQSVSAAASRLLASPAGVGAAPLARGPAVDALQLLANHWPWLRTGITGEQLYRNHGSGGEWRRLMLGMPMVEYAERVAYHFLLKFQTPAGRVLELGAGAGNTTRRVKPYAAHYLATDAHPQQAGTRRFNFDGSWKHLPTYDAILATNALHCSADPEGVIEEAVEHLAPGGILIVGEGEAWMAPDQPWYLDLLFQPMRGWYDRGGFRPWPFWPDALAAAGLQIGYERITFGDWHLGGVIWGEKT